MSGSREIDSRQLSTINANGKQVLPKSRSSTKSAEHHLASTDNLGIEMLNAFTVDVEDYFQVSAFERDIDRATWDRYPCRVENNTLRLLELLSDHEVTGTFFVVGWIAERYPDLVRAIRDAGHEIGSHSYWHRLVYSLTPNQFRDDVAHSRKILEDILGETIRVFRAPSFSITRRSLWALEILVEQGFQIDSSIFPVYHDRYGVPDADPTIHEIVTPSGSLWECPPSVVRRCGINLPVSGGGYFRLYPAAQTMRWLRRINHVNGRPFVFYVHPWELDPKQPRLIAGSIISRWRHYLNLASTDRKLNRLLQSFRFGSLSNVLAAVRNVSLASAAINAFDSDSP